MYMDKAGHLERLIGALDVSDLQDIAVMQGYIKQRGEEGAARGTIHKEIVTMRQALYAALEAKRIRFDPRICFPRFKVRYKPKERWLTPDEFSKLLTAFGTSDDPVMHRQGSPHRQLWLLLAVYTGGRDSEVDGLRWEDIDWRGRTIRIRGTKTQGSDRTLPLQPVLAAVLGPIKESAGYVVGEWGNVRRDLHAACAKRRADIPPCSPNDLRRTFATWLANMGTPESVVAKMLGHGSSMMVRRVYAQIERSLMTTEIAKLSGACVTGVPDSGSVLSSEAFVSRDSLGKLAEMITNLVLGPGIEPGTRGFSRRAPIVKTFRNKAESEACAISEPSTRRRIGR